MSALKRNEVDSQFLDFAWTLAQLEQQVRKNVHVRP